MKLDPLAEVTARLREAVADVGDTNEVPRGRDDAIAGLEVALRARAASRRRRRVVSILAVAASVVAIGAAGFLASRGLGGGGTAERELGRVRGAVAVRAGHVETLDPGARVTEGTELRTAPGGEAHLDFDSGTAVTLGGGARLRLVEQSKKKRFALEAGSLFAHVAKLAPDERFVVATSDAEIEVRGTAFHITVETPDPACGGGSPTRLDVTEGVVVVRHGGEEITVPAGGRWPACAVRVSSPETLVTPAAPPPTARLLPAPASAVAVTQPSPASKLVDQNDLYNDAMRAKREGKSAQAVATLDRLLAMYPHGPLAESASAERMRLLGATDRSRAAAAARDYLARYPDGFARAEAESFAAGRP